MRVLLAPGQVGTLTAAEAAAALAQGWAESAPADDLDVCAWGEATLADRVGEAGLVVTGESVFDAASLLGEVGRIAALAQGAGVPCLVVAAQVAVGRREAAARGVDEAYALADEAGPAGRPAHAHLAAAHPDDPARHLRALAARAARQWSGR